MSYVEGAAAQQIAKDREYTKQSIKTLHMRRYDEFISSYLKNNMDRKLDPKTLMTEANQAWTLLNDKIKAKWEYFYGNVDRYMYFCPCGPYDVENKDDEEEKEEKEHRWMMI
ncbi:MAG: hypothetical protein EBU93_03225 [Chlamydiae bacterium]|nr:hypothetical protein [Chlamydiota bacterium]